MFVKVIRIHRLFKTSYLSVQCKATDRLSKTSTAVCVRLGSECKHVLRLLSFQSAEPTKASLPLLLVCLLHNTGGEVSPIDFAGLMFESVFLKIFSMQLNLVRSLFFSVEHCNQLDPAFSL